MPAFSMLLPFSSQEILYRFMLLLSVQSAACLMETFSCRAKGQNPTEVVVIFRSPQPSSIWCSAVLLVLTESVVWTFLTCLSLHHQICVVFCCWSGSFHLNNIQNFCISITPKKRVRTSGKTAWEITFSSSWGVYIWGKKPKLERGVPFRKANNNNKKQPKEGNLTNFLYSTFKADQSDFWQVGNSIRHTWHTSLPHVPWFLAKLVQSGWHFRGQCSRHGQNCQNNQSEEQSMWCRVTH